MTRLSGPGSCRQAKPISSASGASLCGSASIMYRTASVLSGAAARPSAARTAMAEPSLSVSRCNAPIARNTHRLAIVNARSPKCSRIFVTSNVAHRAVAA